MDVILYQVPSYDYLTTPNAVELQQSLYETDALLPLHKKQRHYQHQPASTDQYELYQNQIELQGVKRVKNSVQGQFVGEKLTEKLCTAVISMLA